MFYGCQLGLLVVGAQISDWHTDLRGLYFRLSAVTAVVAHIYVSSNLSLGIFYHCQLD